MTTGKTSLIQKDKSEGNIASNYRPITFLPMMRKLLTGIISERLYNYLEKTNTIPHQQKGSRRKLLIDKMVMKNILKSSGIRLAEVNIRRGIFQGDSLSLLLLIVAMIPMPKVLQKMDAGYQLKKRSNKIKHLMFMDDIKLYGKSIKEIDILVHTVHRGEGTQSENQYGAVTSLATATLRREKPSKPPTI
ncbi:uncharacterized protein [Palaemon carinicauda]|uniref:uncharacterized protein n=1 Tax=Palaemon carinicauda TaxID=392227 RepID=UPI0035B6535B